jgi:hypothetical protein
MGCAIQAFEEAGGFDESFIRAGHEDVDLGRGHLRHNDGFGACPVRQTCDLRCGDSPGLFVRPP